MSSTYINWCCQVNAFVFKDSLNNRVPLIYLAQLCLVFEKNNNNKTEISLCFQHNCSNHDSLGHPGHVYVTKMAIRKGFEHVYIKLIS